MTARISALPLSPAPPQIHPIFKGLEDPRGFSYKGRAYISATINLEHKNIKDTGYIQQKIAIVMLSEDLRHIQNVTILHQPYIPQVRAWLACSAGHALRSQRPACRLVC